MNKSELALTYFKKSNQSDFEEIAKLFDKDIIYKSQNTGEYISIEAIMKMQKAFHAKFMSLNWKVLEINETDKNTVCIKYNFNGVYHNGEKLSSTGLEYITFKADKIIKIVIENI